MISGDTGNWKKDLFSAQFGSEHYKSISVLILGSYTDLSDPEATKCIDLLKQIKVFLKEKGVGSPDLVACLPDQPELATISPVSRDYVKSIRYIDDMKFDFLVFVFSKGCDFGGVGMELQYAYSQNYHDRTVVAIDTQATEEISPIIRGAAHLHAHDRIVIYYNGIKELEKGIFSVVKSQENL